MTPSISIASPYALVLHLDTGKLLYAKSPDTPVPVASLTKLMTVYLASRAITEGKLQKDAKVTITPEMTRIAPEFVIAGLTVGQVVTLEDLLYLTLLPSNADAAQALALTVSDSLKDFVTLMNSTTSAWGMHNTHFSNVVGYDTADAEGYGTGLGQETNFSTASDISTLLAHALANPIFKTVFTTSTYAPTTFPTPLTSTTRSTAETYGLDASIITGAKTGFTNAAGRCLASTATLTPKAPDTSDRPANLLAITLDGESPAGHLTDTLVLYDYFATNYSYRPISEPGHALATIKILDGSLDSLTISEPATEDQYLPSSAIIHAAYTPSDLIAITDDTYTLSYPGGLGFAFWQTLPAGTSLGTLSYLATTNAGTDAATSAETDSDTETLLTLDQPLAEDITFYNYPLIFTSAALLLALLLTPVLLHHKKRKRLSHIH